jgi:acetyl/propionyl-CoA carboxylase alpha subunit
LRESDSRLRKEGRGLFHRAAGETLAVVEAMKMENVVRAERDGTVKAVYAKKGYSLAVDACCLS